MDFELNEEQRMFRDSLRKFLDAEVRPLDDRWGDLEMTAERAKPLLKMLIPWGYVDSEGIMAVAPNRSSSASRARNCRRVFRGVADVGDYRRRGLTDCRHGASASWRDGWLGRSHKAI